MRSHPEPPASAETDAEAPAAPRGTPRRFLIAGLAAGVAVGLLAGFGVGALLLPGGPRQTGAEPRWERQAWRVEDRPSAEYLDAQLQRGWLVERADADGRGTTYVLRRNPAEPTPRPRSQ